MFSQKLIDLRREQVESTFREQFPRGLVEYHPDDVKDYQFRMSGLHDKHGNRTRELYGDEERFVLNEQLLTKISWPYWAERYCTVNLAGQTLGPLYPLWESQKIALEKMGDLEWERYQSGYPDGVCMLFLKARQLGLSTLCEAVVAHRITTHANVNGLLASDVPDNSNFLYDIFERVVDHLPWYLLPEITERVKNDEMVFATASRLMMGASKSTRGADKTDAGGGKKGQLGRGKTVSVVHLSELATWTNPGQIDTALEPGIPRSLMTFWAEESTAQGRGPANWWWAAWQNAKAGRGRSRPVFIGWWAEKEKYWLPAPVEWELKPATLVHAKRIEETSPRWLNGRTYVPTRDQMYWYETTREEKTAKGGLEDFLQEYPADDDEAFQFSGKSIFPVMLRERVKDQARPIHGMVEIRSNRELGAI